jgi:hypothetical protein
LKSLLLPDCGTRRWAQVSPSSVVALLLTAAGWQARAKRRAWQKVVDEGVTPEEAQKQYVELVDKLLNMYGDKSKDPAE